MAPKLRAVTLFACALMLLACSAPWSSSGRSPVTTPSSAIVLPSVTDTAHRQATPGVTVVQVTTATSSPTTAPTTSATPAKPEATPTQRPNVAVSRVAQCCGVFNWIDAQHLLVYDNPAAGQTGAWVVDISTGKRQFLSPNFGIPSQSGLIALPDPVAGRTEIRRIDGSVVSTNENDGVMTWISPNGKRVVWLEDVGIKQVSSLVPRTVRLWSAELDGRNAKSVLEFDASAVEWLPDSQHIIAIGRAPDGRAPGIWMVDTTTGTNGVVVPGTFLQALRLSPDGSRMAYLETLSGYSSQDGVWIANTNGTNRVHLRETGAYRWAGDSSHLWFLDLAPREGGNDTLVLVDVRDDSVVERIELGGRVLNDQWNVSPDGSIVAYWNETDQAVVVKGLTR